MDFINAKSKIAAINKLAEDYQKVVSTDLSFRSRYPKLSPKFGRLNKRKQIGRESMWDWQAKFRDIFERSSVQHQALFVYQFATFEGLLGMILLHVEGRRELFETTGKTEEKGNNNLVGLKDFRKRFKQHFPETKFLVSNELSFWKEVRNTIVHGNGRSNSKLEKAERTLGRNPLEYKSLDLLSLNDIKQVGEVLLDLIDLLEKEVALFSDQIVKS
ncbi:hypothetical protein KFE98_17105 [bacterium SCSIO 12741]|nr:hypothetical protein KFE98_17105 [bacterium SCSIO 12741]